MLVTMFTDASFYVETKTAAWAMWAKSERGTIRKAGLFPGDVHSSGEAEAKAIANGLFCLSRSDIIEPGDRVLVTCDNTEALATVHLPKAIQRPKMRDVATAIDRIKDAHDLHLVPRHVKSHSGTGIPRLWVHDQCDKVCRQLARTEHLKRLKGGPNGKHQIIEVDEQTTLIVERYTSEAASIRAGHDRPRRGRKNGRVQEPG